MKLYQVTSSIYLSGSIVDYSELTKKKITSVINCRAECHDQVGELTKRGIAYYWIPIPEGQAPRTNQITMFIDLMAKRERDERTLVHCSEGRGRSPFLIAAYLTSISLTLKWAWGNIKKVKPDVSLTEIQRDKLSEYIREN